MATTAPVAFGKVVSVLKRDGCPPTLAVMDGPAEFHAHIYFDADEIDSARLLAERARAAFDVRVGRFHVGPVGPHPRGSCQLTVPAGVFGRFAEWAVVNRGTLTIFAHAETGDDLADHSQHVIWFGPSEPLDLARFG